ncbi:hypothetical protein ACFSCX_14345 [Bacillus salitolerans]|uniref:ABC transmembrane type-1 domain-containing protein n=1 Tax=Bacillus salitolerans TaxID=1437434 RepID=A0ABW4LT87_9BACI
MKFISKFILIIIGFTLISALPALVVNAVQVSTTDKGVGSIFKPYFTTVYDNVVLLFQPENWVYQGFRKTYPLFPMFWDRYSYSMKVFVLSLIIALALAFLFMITIQLAPKKVRKLLISVFTILESLPDVFIIISLQLLVILYFKRTGVLLAQVAVFQEDIYTLPVACLSIIPTFLLLRTVLFFIQEEESKMYVDLAKVKGLSNVRILLIHTFRNVLYSLFYRSKLIFSFMLSNLFIIEVLFNMDGALQFLTRARGAEFIIAATLIFIPFYLFFSLTEKFVLQFIGESGEAA